MNILIGIGNVLRGDDGFGPYVAQRFKHSNWKCIDAGTAPEAYVSVIRKEKPNMLIMVDAVDMDKRVGTIKEIEANAIGDMSIGTHNMPLSLFMTYIKPHCGKVVFYGVQPKEIKDSMEISKDLRMAADRLMMMLGRM